jgi:hypothetical protein
MTDIYPAPDQTVSAVIAELEALDLVYDTDFRLHYAWDAQPYIQATPDAYEKWSASRSSEDDTPAAEKAEAEDPESGAGEDKTKTGSDSAHKATKRR